MRLALTILSIAIISCSPKSNVEVLITGDVVTPGKYVLEKDSTIQDALAIANGHSPDKGDLDSDPHVAWIMHNNSEEKTHGQKPDKRIEETEYGAYTLQDKDQIHFPIAIF